MTGVLLRERKGLERQRETRKEGRVKTEAEIGVVLPRPGNTRSRQRLEEARKDSFLEEPVPLEGVWPGRPPYFGLLAFATLRE